MPVQQCNGISIVIYASKIGNTVCLINDVGNRKLYELLKSIEDSVKEKKYSWKVLERYVPRSMMMIITSRVVEDMPDL